MKTCYLDANVLVYYKNEESPFFGKASEIIQQLVEDNYRLFVSPLVLDEFLHSIKSLCQSKKVKKPEIFRLLRRALKDILALPALEIVNPPLAKSAQLRIVSLMKNHSLRPRDAYHLLIIQENNIQSFATFDSDFKAVFKKGAISKVESFAKEG